MRTDCCDTGRIMDAECRYDNGKFLMHRLPGCLPKLFTVRFTAPADYTAGDVVVVDGKEFPVLAATMAAAASGAFAAGAVLHCVVDRDRELVFLQPSGAGGGIAAGYVGEYREFLLRPEKLPFGWRFPSGEYVEKTSLVGQALLALDADMKNDFGVVEQGTTIRLFDPDVFFVQTGEGRKGRFARPVDGVDFQPGTTEDDAIRNITGSFNSVNNRGHMVPRIKGMTANGAYALGPTYNNDVTTQGITLNTYTTSELPSFDASLVVPTAAENRPSWFGVTPAVYIGA